jgi:hypothetical protein
LGFSTHIYLVVCTQQQQHLLVSKFEDLGIAVSKRTQTTRQDATANSVVFVPSATTGQGSWGLL